MNITKQHDALNSADYLDGAKPRDSIFILNGADVLMLTSHHSGRLCASTQKAADPAPGVIVVLSKADCEKISAFLSRHAAAQS